MPQSTTDRLLPPVRPLTARSVVLSTLLGYDPPSLPVRALVRVGGLFGIAERTIRVAVTRMVVEGDLVGDRGSYRLTDRLLRRQRQQRESCSPQTVSWQGVWQMAVVTTGPRPLAERVKLRRSMLGLRLAEWREGVWIRPANLTLDPDDSVGRQCAFLDCAPRQNPVELAHQLWDLPAWSDEAERLTSQLEKANSLVEGFMTTAAVIRHLLIDPVLPQELLPDDWPGRVLRERYAAFSRSYATLLRAYSES